ncbi:hypothetical protein O3669_04955 [Pauljensenia sp. 20925_1_34]|jgi:hypothetical protein|uniref:hypothetical protein n=1 Tax=Pauljensenia sp. 20925_1_34 TaxID=3003674 RepID=UPI0028E1C19E|nr:hypothetical protein [uncultured Actinomyces sp.]
MPQPSPTSTPQDPSPTPTSRRKRWIATASCVGLVAAAAGAGYWWHSTRVPDLTRIEAWSRYMELIESGKYDEALSYSPYLQDTSRNGNHIEFLSDAAHAHAPSTVSIEPVDINSYAIEGRVSFDDGTEALLKTVTVLSQKDKANGKLGWWHIDASSFGSTVRAMKLDNLRSVRVGDVSIDNPQGWYYLFPGSYRIEAVPQNPDYWTIKYEYPLTDGAGEIRTNPITRPYTIEANDTLKEWVREQSEVFATSCRTGTPDASREDACGALAYSTTPFDPTQDYLSVDLVGTTSFLLAVSTGETAPTDDGHTHYNARFKCTIDFAYDGATPTTECTLDK